MRVAILAVLLACACLPPMTAAASSHRSYSSTSHSRGYTSRNYTRSYTPRSYTQPYTPRTRSYSYSPRSTSPSRSGYYSSPGSTSSGIVRNSRGQIRRSTAAKDSFKHQQPCPANGKSSGPCPGYVIDHIKPLECGGADAPSNMQWQTITEGKKKDKTERFCR